MFGYSINLSMHWAREIERDILALGSIIFYFLVVGRALVGPFWDLFTPLMVVAAILTVVYLFTKEIDMYVARALVVSVFVTLHYNDLIFGVFAAVILIALIFSSYHLGNSKQKIIGGITLGLACSAIAYPIALNLR